MCVSRSKVIDTRCIDYGTGVTQTRRGHITSSDDNQHRTSQPSPNENQKDAARSPLQDLRHALVRRLQVTLVRHLSICFIQRC